MGKQQELNRSVNPTVILKAKYIVCLVLLRMLHILKVHFFCLSFQIME